MHNCFIRCYFLGCYTDLVFLGFEPSALYAQQALYHRATLLSLLFPILMEEHSSESAQVGKRETSIILSSSMIKGEIK